MVDVGVDISIGEDPPGPSQGLSFPSGATGQYISGPAVHPETASPVLSGYTGPPGNLPLFIPVRLPPVPGAALAMDFTGDFYYRIWITPFELRVRNPKIGEPVPFSIWNAYPFANPLTGVDSRGATGLEIPLAAGRVLRGLEFLTSDITITAAADAQTDAEFDFRFRDGSGTLYFSASIVNIVEMVPETPVYEEMIWKTDIQISYSSNEQRIALRAQPRSSMNMVYSIHSDDDWQHWSRLLDSRIPVRVQIPYYQYATTVNQDITPGSDEVIYDNARTNIRAGEQFLITDGGNRIQLLLKAQEINASGCRVGSPISSPVPSGSLIVPCVNSRIKDPSALRMQSVVGRVRVTTYGILPVPSLRRPEYVSSPVLVDGIPVLLSRPLARSLVMSSYEAGLTVLDEHTGYTDMVTSWPHAFESGHRDFHVLRPGMMDWWRDFLETIRGMQKPFLMATWRNDFRLAEDVAAGSGKMKILGTADADTYSGRLNIQINAPVSGKEDSHFAVASVTAVPGEDASIIDIKGSLPSIPKSASVSRLMLCRLSSDTVKWTHHQNYSIVRLTIRTIDQ